MLYYAYYVYARFVYASVFIILSFLADSLGSLPKSLE
jgi:hypothetical protein